MDHLRKVFPFWGGEIFLLFKPSFKLKNLDTKVTD